MVMQHKTQRPVQFKITPATCDAVQKWTKQAGLRRDGSLPNRIHDSPDLGTRPYARILEGWADKLGPDPTGYGTQLDEAHQGDTDLSAHKEPFAPCNFYLAIPNSSQRLGTSASKWTTPWKSLNRQRSERRVVQAAR